jgi:hypothetical protein
MVPNTDIQVMAGELLTSTYLLKVPILVYLAYILVMKKKLKNGKIHCLNLASLILGIGRK